MRPASSLIHNAALMLNTHGGTPMLRTTLHTIPVLTLFLLLLPTPSQAQHWTAEEQELIDAIEACWATWNAERFEVAFLEVCRPTEATTYWWTPDTAPLFAVSDWIRNLQANRENRVLSQDLRPLRVQVSGPFGFIWFHGIRLYQSADGSREVESWRGFEVWQRTPEGWSFFGGMGTPDAGSADTRQ